MANEISPKTRRSIADELDLLEGSVAGKLTEPNFLSRLFNLAEMPSHDYRFKTAYEDITKHRVMNNDWPNGWFFTDPRFNILNRSDSFFLEFLAETLHPVVVLDELTRDNLLGVYNRALAKDGFELSVSGTVQGKPIFSGAKRVAGASHVQESGATVKTHLPVEESPVSPQNDVQREQALASPSEQALHQLAGDEAEAPVVFISYSWDDEEHKIWVLNLANELIRNGVKVLLDRYELKLGGNMIHFMEDAISKADKVVVVLTPNYKLKADKRSGGVGYEYSILNSDLYRRILSNDKYLPVLRRGETGESIPVFMQQFFMLDMRDNGKARDLTEDLLREIFDEPQLVKPQLGKRPDFAAVREEALKEKLRQLFDKINPAILGKLAVDDKKVRVMISQRNLIQLEELMALPEAAQLISVRSTGSVIMGGSGNKIDGHMNDLAEGFMQGFEIKSLSQL